MGKNFTPGISSYVKKTKCLKNVLCAKKKCLFAFVCFLCTNLCICTHKSPHLYVREERECRKKKKVTDGSISPLYWDPLRFSDGLRHPRSTSFIIFPGCAPQHPSSLIQPVLWSNTKKGKKTLNCHIFYLILFFKIRGAMALK